MIEIDPNKQYILAGDISASMQTVDPKCGGQARYPYMVEKFEQFIRASEDFNPDGPTVLLFGEKVQVFRNTNLQAVDATLRNVNFEGWTNTHLVIEQAYKLHVEEKKALAKDGKSHPGTVLMLFTDGSPTNRRAVQDTIRTISNEIDRDEEFSIAFLTVGTIDSELDTYLTNLDDNLKGAKYDIVDVKKLEDVDFLAAVKGAITD